MALYPWRFQADITKGDADPMVTVFVGPERAVMDASGNPTTETFIEQTTNQPSLVPLSQLAAALADTTLLTRNRQK
jgi:hypothetical protein